MKKYIVHFYLGLSCLYVLQGTLYASGGSLSRLLLAIRLIISVYFFFVANLQYKLPKVLKILSVLIVGWVLYGSLSLMSGPVVNWISPYYYLRNILDSLLPIYVFYVFAKRGQLTDRILAGWLYVFVIVGIAQFYRYSNLYQQKTEQEEYTNNAGYMILSILPLLPLLNRRPLVQYSLLALMMFYVLQGFKRGAIIAGSLSSMFFFIENYFIHRKTKTGVDFKQIFRVLLTIGLVIASVYVVQLVMSSSDYFIKRLEDSMEGNSSGRDDIYSTYYFWFINQSNPFQFLFGNGGDATLRIFGQYAHNDWLEIAINNGFMMLILYAIYWFLLIRETFKIRKKDSIAFMMMGMFVIIYFFRAFVSMSYNDISVYAASALGYALAVGGSSSGENKSDVSIKS